MSSRGRVAVDRLNRPDYGPSRPRLDARQGRWVYCKCIVAITCRGGVSDGEPDNERGNSRTGAWQSGALAVREGKREARSGLSVDQRTEHFVGALDHAGAELGSVLADFQLDKLFGEFGDRLGIAQRGRTGGGDAGCGLLDALLTVLEGAQPGAHEAVGDLHGSLHALSGCQHSSRCRLRRQGASSWNLD